MLYVPGGKQAKQLYVADPLTNLTKSVRFGYAGAFGKKFWPVLPPSIITKIDSDGSNTWMLDDHNQLWGCGNMTNGIGGAGQGSGSQTTSNLKVRYTGIKDFTCALNIIHMITLTGDVYNAGVASSGQLGRVVTQGNGTLSNPNYGKVNLPSPCKKIYAHNSGTIFLLEDGTAWAVGSSPRYELGLILPSVSYTTSNLTQLVSPNGFNWVDFKLTQGDAFYGGTANGDWFAAGNNDYGQLAIATGVGTSNPPVIFAADLLDISVSIAMLAYINTEGILYTCGLNRSGRLGHTSGSGTKDLTQITAVGSAKAVVCDQYHMHYITQAGDLRNCGMNTYGDLGRVGANVSGDKQTNIDWVPLTRVKSVTINDNYGAVFVLEDGTVYNAGHNNAGQLGRAVADGTTTSPNLGVVPVDPALKAVITYDSSFFIGQTRTFSCGNNSRSQLGRAVNTASPTVSNLGVIPL